eukprot:GHVL01010379.1.p1 GENE.GHVL01010379.1~~GHVL01010379.1.p1  ORF type:complete len:453 (+),score=49.83 GHVL01010379.1:304-1662(+)
MFRNVTSLILFLVLFEILSVFCGPIPDGSQIVIMEGLCPVSPENKSKRLPDHFNRAIEAMRQSCDLKIHSYECETEIGRCTIDAGSSRVVLERYASTFGGLDSETVDHQFTRVRGLYSLNVVAANHNEMLRKHLVPCTGFCFFYSHKNLHFFVYKAFDGLNLTDATISSEEAQNYMYQLLLVSEQISKNGYWFYRVTTNDLYAVGGTLGFHVSEGPINSTIKRPPVFDRRKEKRIFIPPISLKMAQNWDTYKSLSFKKTKKQALVDFNEKIGENDSKTSKMHPPYMYSLGVIASRLLCDKFNQLNRFELDENGQRLTPTWTKEDAVNNCFGTSKLKDEEELQIGQIIWDLTAPPEDKNSLSDILAYSLFDKFKETTNHHQEEGQIHILPTKVVYNHRPQVNHLRKPAETREIHQTSVVESEGVQKRGGASYISLKSLYVAYILFYTIQFNMT